MQQRLAVGMVLLGAIVEVHELDLVVSLPNNLVGHVAITDISDALSAQVEKASGQLAKIGETEEDEDEEDAMDAEAAEDEDAMDAAPAQKKKSSNGKTKASSETKLPDLKAMFTVGQLVQCSVLTVEAQPARKKLDLSINPTVINSGLGQKDIQAGQIICVAIKSREDHGYALDLGIADVTGFLPTDKTSGDALHVGQVLTTTIQAITASGRAVTVASNTMAMTSTSSVCFFPHFFLLFVHAFMFYYQTEIQCPSPHSRRHPRRPARSGPRHRCHQQGADPVVPVALRGLGRCDPY